MQSPVVILIRPQMGENIGAVARAMGNFGLSEMRIVAPRDGWPNAQAEAMAGHALPILQAARVFPDMIPAMADIVCAYATTARLRDVEKRVVTPEAVMQEIMHTGTGHAGKVALVFGPERTGLTNEDVSWCDSIVTIPTTEYASLNLAQSVVVMGYEWFKCSSAERYADCERDVIPMPAPLEQYEQLFRKLEDYLEAAEFFKVAEKKPGMWLNIKNMLLRGRFTEQEIRTLHGMIRALAEKKSPS